MSIGGSITDFMTGDDEPAQLEGDANGPRCIKLMSETDHGTDAVATWKTGGAVDGKGTLEC